MQSRPLGEGVMNDLIYMILVIVIFFVPMTLLSIMAWIVGYSGEPDTLMYIYSLSGVLLSAATARTLATSGERN